MACTGSTCEWVVPKGGGGQCCDGGGTSCWRPKLLEAEVSRLHDQGLADATRKINKILAGIPADARGRKLSLLHTNMGPFLAWLHHDKPPVTSGVTAKDDDATVAKALKLKVPKAAGAGRR